MVCGGYLAIVVIQALNVYLFITTRARWKQGCLTRSASMGLSAYKSSPYPFYDQEGRWLAHGPHDIRC